MQDTNTVKFTLGLTKQDGGEGTGLLVFAKLKTLLFFFQMMKAQEK